MRDAVVRLRLVRSQPEELRRREPRQRTIARQADQPLEADPLLDLDAFSLGALVVPEDRRPHHGAVGVEDDQAVHLARETDPEEVEPTHLLEGLLGRRPPVRGILLGPARAWRRERVAVLAPRED